MARYDVYRNRHGEGYLLDCQADSLNHLNSRVVVPLLLEEVAPVPPASRLNPLFEIEGEIVSMTTQFAGAIPVRELGPKVGSLDLQHDRIMAALDMLLIGY